MEENYTDRLPPTRKQIEKWNNRNRAVRDIIERENRNPFQGKVIKAGTYHYQMEKQENKEISQKSSYEDKVDEILKKSPQRVQEEATKIIETQRKAKEQEDVLNEKIKEIFDKSSFQTSSAQQAQIAQLLEKQRENEEKGKALQKRLEEILGINNLQEKADKTKKQIKGEER